MKKKITVTLLFSLILCAAVCLQIPQSISASANSASPYWEGAYGTGVYSADSNCPLQVKSENLTFYITGLPVDGVTENYTSSVCAEYEFYNPESYDITAHMLFPFGAEPDYYFEIEENSDLDSIYGVTINGENAGASMRYSYISNKYNFKFSRDYAYLHDEKMQLNGFNESTPVTKVTIAETESEYAAATYTLTLGETIVITDVIDSYDRIDEADETKTVRLTFDESDETSFYVLGELPEITANEVTRTYSGSGGYGIVSDELGNEIQISAESAGTLGEFLQSINPLPDGEYSEIDWFNFSLYFIYYGSGYNRPDYSAYITYAENYSEAGSSISYYMMRWYGYDMTVKAGETVVNAVTAPTYPTINTAKNPYTYEFSYLLSPAATWNSFENLTITINAPYYMLYSSVDFSMTGSVEDGTAVYTAAFESLPDGELYFTLCEVESPESTSSSSGTVMIIFIVLVIVFIYIIPAVGIITGIIIGIVFLVRHYKKKKGQ